MNGPRLAVRLVAMMVSLGMSACAAHTEPNDGAAADSAHDVTDIASPDVAGDTTDSRPIDATMDRDATDASSDVFDAVIVDGDGDGDVDSAVDDAFVTDAPADARGPCCAYDSDCPPIEGYPAVCRLGRCRPAAFSPPLCWSDVDCDGGHCVGAAACACPETCSDPGIGSCMP